MVCFTSQHITTLMTDASHQDTHELTLRIKAIVLLKNVKYLGIVSKMMEIHFLTILLKYTKKKIS